MKTKLPMSFANLHKQVFFETNQLSSQPHTSLLLFSYIQHWDRMEVLVFGPWSNDQDEGLECVLFEETCKNGTYHEKYGEDNTRRSKDTLKVWKKMVRFFKKMKQRKARSLILIEKSSDSTQVTSSDLSWSSASSIDTKAESPSSPIPLIKSRILDMAIMDGNDIDFVPDRVSKEVIACSDHSGPMEGPESDTNVIHVKTGVWQVTCLEDDGSPQPPYYAVTAVSMTDRVDTKKLRKALFSGKTFKRRPKLIMAPTDIAERLTGYKSGTMAPICHTVNSKLFVEESIVNHKEESDSTLRVNVGSGMFGKCLSVPLQDFIRIGEANPEGMKICPLIQRRRR